MFQTATAAKLSAPSVAASLLLHAAGILLVCLVSFAESPFDLHARRFAQVALVAPSLEIPARHAFRAAPRSPSKLVPRSRLFEALPPRAPELHPKLALDLPPTPVLDLVRTPMPEPLPAAELPSFVSPPAPLAPKVTVKAAGFASAENAGTDPSPRRRGLEAASGFAPESAPPAATPAHSATHGAGFGDASVAAPSTARLSQNSSEASTVAAEILDKPRPSYTDEARRLNIEGEVLLEVVFEASGKTRVLRVLRGLGHGLDESATAAARQIHFRPAQRDRVAIDSTAVVHIIFQLAH